MVYPADSMTIAIIVLGRASECPDVKKISHVNK